MPTATMLAMAHPVDPARRMALIAADEFWDSPVFVDVPAADGPEADVPVADPPLAQAEDDGTSSNVGDGHSCDVELPAPHHQLLSDEPATYEDLKGYDHTRETTSHDDRGPTGEEPPFPCRQRLSAVKMEGGGSWLLGFARLNEKPPAPLPSSGPAEEDGDLDLPLLVRGESADELSSDSEDDASEEGGPPPPPSPGRRGVSFDSVVAVQPIPHSSTLSAAQRCRMYSSCWEVHQNKIRGKAEYRYDGYDWRNATEEWEMHVDMETGELVHPVHDAT